MILENDFIKAAFRTKGAELISIYNKKTQLEYLWNGNPAFWAKHSPVLFPIVGSLKENHYLFEGQSYSLSRHGFARDSEFEVESNTGNNLVFYLGDSPETQAVYPFKFEFRIQYTLVENTLIVSYLVENPGQKDLLFSVGGHPAFQVPLVGGTAYEDYYLEFDQTEDLKHWPLADNGLIESEPVLLRANTSRLPLTHELFYEDALVFKQLNATHITLKSDKTPHQLAFHFENFPFLGIWAAPNAPFVCIEPWCGIADSVKHDQNLETKEGINRLAPTATFKRNWSISLT
ncbi:MAG: aldose 1-epimerase family protein [Siphonobacter sp.]